MAVEHTSLFVGGEWRAPAGGGRLSVISPVTEQVIASVPEATVPDADAAVAAARAAFDDPYGWSSWTPDRRADALDRLAAALESRSAATVRAVSSQNGMPVGVGRRSEAVIPATLLRYYAAMVRRAPDEDERAALAGGRTLVRREPVGVVAAIVPWNYPQSLTFFKLAPALAAGCTVVVKPAPETVLDAYVLADAIVEAGLPPGVVSILPGGRETGAYLVEHPGVDKVAFTGSTAAGRAIAAA